ncbi:MAG: hypothetical protein FD133_188 [Erysipelotrichaceae bacterium]|nr:MAG: hypothetical protein FD133_188 [Erysipelotrichaceae bacterium]
MWTQFGQGFDSPHFHQFGELAAVKRFLFILFKHQNHRKKVIFFNCYGTVKYLV